jgi:hypothetical protein
MGNTSLEQFQESPIHHMPVLPIPRHERFAQQLASGMSGTAAYEAAGYKPSPGAASRLSKSDKIRQRVADLLSEREQRHSKAVEKAIERTALTKEWVIGRLIENAERALQARGVVTAKGEPTGEYRYDGMVANRALELLGKELGMFIDRKEVGAPGEFQDLDEAALLGEIRREAEAIGVPISDTAH